MIEAPRDMEMFFHAQAVKNGTSIIRGVPVELRCQSAEFADATFLVYWPDDDEHLHMLVPKQLAKGRA